MDKEELKTTNLWNVTITADQNGNPLYLTFGGVKYVKEGQQSASGLVNEIPIETKLDKEANVWVGHYKPLDIMSQGDTPAEAIQATRSAVLLNLIHMTGTSGQVKEVKWPEPIEYPNNQPLPDTSMKYIDGWNACHDAFMKIIYGGK